MSNELIKPRDCSFNIHGEEMYLQPHVMTYAQMEQFLALVGGNSLPQTSDAQHLRRLPSDTDTLEDSFAHYVNVVTI